MSAKGLELQERDYEILRLVQRFRFCLGRHVQVLCGFSGARASDRRLKLLLDAGYLERKSIYTASHTCTPLAIKGASSWAQTSAKIKSALTVSLMIFIFWMRLAFAF